MATKDKQLCVAPYTPPTEASPTAPILDPFSPDRLRLSQDFTGTVGVKKLLLTVPCRRAPPQHFIRVRAGEAWRENFAIIELKDDREDYIVDGSLVPELLHEIVSKTLFLAINRQGDPFFWPIRLPDPTGKDNQWWVSARDAAERATQSWLRIKSNQSLGAYDVFQAEANWPDPEWPEKTYWELIEIGFKGKIINTPDHPVLKRLRGSV